MGKIEEKMLQVACLQWIQNYLLLKEDSYIHCEDSYIK